MVTEKHTAFIALRMYTVSQIRANILLGEKSVEGYDGEIGRKSPLGRPKKR